LSIPDAIDGSPYTRIVSLTLGLLQGENETPIPKIRLDFLIYA